MHDVTFLLFSLIMSSTIGGMLGWYITEPEYEYPPNKVKSDDIQIV